MGSAQHYALPYSAQGQPPSSLCATRVDLTLSDGRRVLVEGPTALSAVVGYHNRSVDALQVLQELIDIAKDLRDEPEDGLSQQERAFYDALAQNDSAVEIMSNEELRIIATELVDTVRKNSGTDWWRRDNVRAKMRITVKKILQRHGFPPDLASDAVKTVLKQAEALATSVS